MWNELLRWVVDQRRDCKLKCEIEMQNGKPSVMESVNLYILEIQIRLQ